MNAKLTPKLVRQVIESTKRYARERGTSLSRLVIPVQSIEDVPALSQELDKALQLRQV